MKYFNLDKQEEEIIKNFDNGKFVSVSKLKTEKAKYKKYAQAAQKLSKTIHQIYGNKKLPSVEKQFADLKY